MLKKIRIEITTVRYEVLGSLYEAADKMPAPVPDALPASPADVARTVFVTDASYHDDGHRVCIRYTENTESGMEGTRTTVAFQKVRPNSVSILRDGAVKTALEFAQGQRYCGVYQTPIMPFELCLFPRLVANGMEKTGTLQLDYVIQIKGAQAERTKLTLRIL